MYKKLQSDNQLTNKIYFMLEYLKFKNEINDNQVNVMFK